MRVSFLFWNVQQRPLEGLIAGLVVHEKIDIVMLAECVLGEQSLLGALRRVGETAFVHPFSLAKDIRVITRLPESHVESVFDDQNGHLSVRRLVIGRNPEVLLFVVHYHSKRDWSDADQDMAATKLSRQIVRFENELGHQRTILVGDLNMNPFANGVVGAMGLHAVMTRDFAAERTRVVDADAYRMFYNPMWGFFGDRSDGPPGTHWYRPAKPIVYGWNIYDQVLLRPDLMDKLLEVRIIDRVGERPLTRPRGTPDATVGSDHLPLLFALDL